MRKLIRYGLYTAGVAAAVVALQAALPHRLEERRSIEVLGKLNIYLSWKPRGVALSLLSDAFRWDLACAVRADVLPETFAQQTGITLPRELELGGSGRAWLLVFVDGARAVAATEVPIIGVGDIDQAAPYTCVESQEGFLAVEELSEPGQPPRRFALRS